jgi:hypothetical protein
MIPRHNNRGLRPDGQPRKMDMDSCRNYSLFLSENGDVHYAGTPTYISTQHSSASIAPSYARVKVGTVPTGPYSVKVSCGYAGNPNDGINYGLSAVLSGDGHLYLFGYGSTKGGTGGMPTASVGLRLWTSVPQHARPVDVMMMESSSLIVYEDGSVYGCGLNEYGNLGTHPMPSADTFKKVDFGDPNAKIISIKASTKREEYGRKIIFETDDDRFFICGSLGLGPRENTDKESYAPYGKYIPVEVLPHGSLTQNSTDPKDYIQLHGYEASYQYYGPTTSAHFCIRRPDGQSVSSMYGYLRNPNLKKIYRDPTMPRAVNRYNGYVPGQPDSGKPSTYLCTGYFPWQDAVLHWGLPVNELMQWRPIYLRKGSNQGL